jgi:hypothetical protein
VAADPRQEEARSLKITALLLLSLAGLCLYSGVTSGDASKLLVMSLMAWGICSVIKHIPLD